MAGTARRTGGRVDLWLRWVLANSVGEAVGLGATALVGFALFTTLGTEEGLFPALLLAAVAILAGTAIEGPVLGTGQWLVLRQLPPGLRWKTWALATAAGAFVAWALGMIPSTVLSLGADTGGAGPSEPGDAVVYGLAFLMGLVLGPVLGVAQWLVLRGYFENALLWMPANALAWAFGMVVVFAGVNLAAAGGAVPVAVLLILLSLAGAVVGAVHGLALVWMLRPVKPGV